MTAGEANPAPSYDGPTTWQVLRSARAVLDAQPAPSASEVEGSLTDCAARVLSIEAETLREERRLDELLETRSAASRSDVPQVHARLRGLDADRVRLTAMMRDLRALA
jgi:hypothetical protein